MSTATETIEGLAKQEYKYGFVTDIEADSAPPGLNEDIIRFISAKKKRAGLAARVAAEGLSPLADHEGAAPGPTCTIRPIDYQDIIYYSAPKNTKQRPEEPGRSRSRSCWRPTRSSASRSTSSKRLAGVAVDAVFDSVSVATTFKEKLARSGHHLLLVLRSGAGASRPGAASTWARWCPTPTISSPRSTRRSSPTARSATSPRACAARWSCPPISASTRKNTGQFERTLIIADEGAYVSYLEGCTAPMRDENQLHAAVVELVALDNATDQVLHRAELVSRRQRRQGRHLQLRHQARRMPRP